jgi:methyl-accepting chemotaxis protein
MKLLGFFVNFRQIMSRIRDASVRINSAVEQMSAASTEQSSSAAQQSGSVSEITSTMAELARTSKEVTGSAERVVNIAAQNEEDVRNGVDAAKDTVAAMDAIKEVHEASTKGIVSLSEKVQQINEVMDVIDDIADRTKMIAFNAALEAAGAGEAGRRFGVVAQEVRRLADTVVEATEDSRRRIVEIQEATNNMVVASERNSRVFGEGFRATQVTADSLQKILDSARNTADSAKQISLSTQQERTALQQVLDAMMEVSEGAALFAKRVSETEGTITNLRELAAGLTELIKRYGGDGKSAAA